jgi:hypothetical protein
VTVKNSGTQAVSLVSIVPTDYETTAIIDSAVLPISIAAGASTSFNLSYYSAIPGEFIESLILISTADVPYYKVDTFQNVISAFSFRPS